MAIVGYGTETFLYINGLGTKHEVKLSDCISLLPIDRKLPLNILANILKHDVDFAISILCAQNIAAQLRISATNAKNLAISAWNAQWDFILLGALFNCNTVCNIQCDKALEEIDSSARMNITNYKLYGVFSEPYYLTPEDEIWIASYYSNARALLDNSSYETAVHSMATFRWHTVPRVQLAIIWSGIEALFDVSTELNFRISLYGALFLSDNDKKTTKKWFDDIKKLYGARSSAVHGGKIKGDEKKLVMQSANLLNQLIRKCAEKNTLPDIDTLLFSS